MHEEDTTMHRPNWKELHQIYGIGSNTNLSGHYLLHTWIRGHKKFYTPETIRSLNSTYGRVVRRVYYGNEALL